MNARSFPPLYISINRNASIVKIRLLQKIENFSFIYFNTVVRQKSHSIFFRYNLVKFLIVVQNKIGESRTNNETKTQVNKKNIDDMFRNLFHNDLLLLLFLLFSTFQNDEKHQYQQIDSHNK